MSSIISPVSFDAPTHTYRNTATDEILISVSQLLTKFKNKFDPTGEITAKYAKKNGLTVPEVLEKWRIINETACTYGTSVHEDLEYFINTGEIRESDNKDFVLEFSKFKFQGKLHSEKRVYSLENYIAGTVDLIERLDSQYINIHDFKTNKKLDKFNFYKQYMHHPFSHLSDCNFNHYQVQLSTYGYLCELFGLKINKLNIFYLNPNSRQIEVHPVRYMRKEVIEMLKIYNTTMREDYVKSVMKNLI